MADDLNRVERALEELRQRVVRTESRIVAGFEALGVYLGADKPFAVPTPDGDMLVSVPARSSSFEAILSAIPESYKGMVIVTHKGDEVGRFVRP